VVVQNRNNRNPENSILASAVELYGSSFLILLCQIMRMLVIPAGKRVSSAMDGKLKAIHAGMTIFEDSNHVI
jgi:hypothetical protein